MLVHSQEQFCLPLVYKSAPESHTRSSRNHFQTQIKSRSVRHQGHCSLRLLEDHHNMSQSSSKTTTYLPSLPRPLRQLVLLSKVVMSRFDLYHYLTVLLEKAQKDDPNYVDSNFKPSMDRTVSTLKQNLGYLNLIGAKFEDHKAREEYEKYSALKALFKSRKLMDSLQGHIIQHWDAVQTTVIADIDSTMKSKMKSDFERLRELQQQWNDLAAQESGLKLESKPTS